MRRRTFIAGLLVATTAGRAHTQQPARLPTIGFLGTTTPSVWKDYVSEFVQRLRELGWVEGRTVAIEYRWAEGRNERFGAIAAEFVRLKVDVIVTSGGAGVAAKQATSTIPIVLALANDPVGSGLAASSGAARRQRHRPVAACSRSGRQAARSFTTAFARCSPILWEMPATPPPWSKWSIFRRQLASSDLRRSCPK